MLLYMYLSWGRYYNDKKENYIFGLISNTENHILGVLFFLIVFLGQTFISLDIPLLITNYYNNYSHKAILLIALM